MADVSRPHDWKDLPAPDRDLADSLIDWFHEHGRDFPWRHTTDPFHILSVEIMLQRTRASQVAPVFTEFRDRFDGPQDVLAVGKDAVAAIFEKLGLLWRADYFWDLQRTLVEEHGGTVPEELTTLRDLPGVGLYAATATRVFAFGARATVVDANVLRIFGRWYGISFPDHARRSPRVAEWASEHAPDNGEPVRIFNWGVIDFGAEVCLAQNPRCEPCPIAEDCWYASA